MNPNISFTEKDNRSNVVASIVKNALDHNSNFSAKMVRYYDGYYFSYITLIYNAVTYNVLEYSTSLKALNLWYYDSKTNKPDISYTINV